MTSAKLYVRLDSINDELFMILKTIEASQVRPGYSDSFKTGAINRVREAIDKIGLALTEIDRLRINTY